MSGLFASLSNNVKALNAQSRAIETAGRNLANVNNPNYARQRVVFGDRGTVQTDLGPQSLGLEALSITQLRDTLLDKQVLRETALQSALTSEQAALQKAQAGLGENIDRASGSTSVTQIDSSSRGISSAINDFFNAFQSLAASPTDRGERQNLLQKASTLADRLQLTDRRLAQVQTDIDSQVNTDVNEANRLLQTIAELNGQIGRLEVNKPGSAVDLRDQRQARLEDLAKIIPFDVQPIAGSTGQLELSVAGTVLVTKALVQGTLAFTGSVVTGGLPATALSLASGSVKGALTARDGTVQTMRDGLDALARQLVTSVNGAYNPTAATGDFFAPAGLTAATFALAPGLNAAALKASDGGPAGANTVALAVANLANTTFTTAGGAAFDGTFSTHYNRTVSDLGQALSSTNSRLDDQTNVANIVRGQRDAVSSVSLDEEMADLLRFQRAFQATSRVFTTVDDLLDTVVNRLGK
ncbi:MAG: flagellar hook-associated protein FlgK [Opitutae bacterium]|nr:flagellar hook-associated protein FlgK [Opitutae bacterium]